MPLNLQDALQACSGHMHATKNHIYGLSIQGLADVAKKVLLLFLQASTTWQSIMSQPWLDAASPKHMQASTLKLPHQQP